MDDNGMQKQNQTLSTTQQHASSRNRGRVCVKTAWKGIRQVNPSKYPSSLGFIYITIITVKMQYFV